MFSINIPFKWESDKVIRVILFACNWILIIQKIVFFLPNLENWMGFLLEFCVMCYSDNNGKKHLKMNAHITKLVVIISFESANVFHRLAQRNCWNVGKFHIRNHWCLRIPCNCVLLFHKVLFIGTWNHLWVPIVYDTIETTIANSNLIER